MQGVLGGIGVIDLPEWPDGRLMEDGRLVPAAFVLALVLNGAQQGELIVIGKGEDIALAVDGSILGGKAVIDLIELILRFAEVQRVPHGKTIEDVEKACWDVGVAVQDGRMFFGPCHLRMNLASPRSRIEEAFRRMDRYVFNR